MNCTFITDMTNICVRMKINVFEYFRKLISLIQSFIIMLSSTQRFNFELFK